MSGLDNWIADQPEPRPSRVEAIRRLIERGLAPAPSEDTAELRRQFLRLAKRVEDVVAYARRVEAERDALAPRAPRLEVVRQSPREPSAVDRWSSDPIRGSTLRSDPLRGDPEAVARARAQLAEAEARAAARAEAEAEAERRRRGDSSTSSGAAPRD
jgi:hypothetical protein